MARHLENGEKEKKRNRLDLGLWEEKEEISLVSNWTESAVPVERADRVLAGTKVCDLEGEREK